MASALYGPNGFYRRELPGSHFRTSVHASPLMAEAVLELAQRTSAVIGAVGFTLVDVGAGGGELLTALASSAPSEWQLVALEIRARPRGLDDRIEWAGSIDREVRGLVIAHEWLDNVPVDVVEHRGGGWCQVLVDEAGAECTGPALTERQCDWLAEWWPPPTEGARAELGGQRDHAWADLAGRLEAGLLVAVDYGLDPARHRAGTLTGYRGGRAVEPVPDGSCDITAHVQLEAVAAAGERAGLTGTQLVAQSDVLASLGVSGRRPPLELAREDPLRYLARLSAATQAAELLDPEGLGGFTWLAQGRGVDPAALLGQPTSADRQGSA
jgi:SAM-dependent MidA family methyltransferase